MPRNSSHNSIDGHILKTNKRKKKFSREPQAKRSKQDESEDDENYSEKFKYILAPKNQSSTVQEKFSSSESERIDETPVVKRKKAKKTKKLDENMNGTKATDNSRKHNGKQKKIKSQNLSKYNYESDSSFYMESCSDEESCEEEWSTDTDYTSHSFHESECESVETDESDDMNSYDSSDDSEYKPPIEDKYVKKGEAIMYDAKGLDIAFGNSFESQIVDLNDVSAAVESDDAPELTPMDINDDVANSQNTECSDESPSKEMGIAEDTLKNLSLNDDDETVLSSQLLQRASFYNCTDNRGVILKLNRTIHFHGILVIKPLINNIQVNGFILHTNQSLKATSISRTDYFLNLTPIIVENCTIDKDELHEQLNKLLETTTDADEILNDFDYTKEVLLHLEQGLPDTKIDMIQTYSSNPILPHKNMILKSSVCPSSELILATKFFVDAENPKLNAYKINVDWDNIELKSSTRLMIIGGKNVGKSAMSQYLINKNISKYPKILLIDLDIGQPICSPAQTVSATIISQPLIGAGYLNNSRVEKSFLFGDKSVMISPFKYNECVLRLIQFCNQNEEFKNIPWIINTMGYQKGFGLQLMCLLLRIIQPTDVCQIQHSNMRYNFKYVLKESYVNNFSFSFFNESYLKKFPSTVYFSTHVLDSIVNNNIQDNNDDGREWTSNATEKRKISMFAQLSKLMNGGHKYLNDMIPFGTCLNNIRLIVIDEEYTQHDNGVNLDLFNGNLVYLCHSDNNEMVDSNSILECYGVGIVRAIDKIHNLIYLLLPQHDDSEKLQALINVLAIGNIPLPSEILLKQNFGVDGIVPHVTFFKDRSMSKKKYINKRNIKDCF